MDEPAFESKTSRHRSTAELMDELHALEAGQRKLQAQIDEGRATRDVLEAFDWIAARVEELAQYVGGMPELADDVYPVVGTP
jgi:hypothetical protein